MHYCIRDGRSTTSSRSLMCAFGPALILLAVIGASSAWAADKKAAPPKTPPAAPAKTDPAAQPVPPKSADASASKSDVKPADKPAEKSGDKAAAKSDEKSGEKPTAGTVSKPDEKGKAAGEKPGKKSGEKAGEKSGEKPAKKADGKTEEGDEKTEEKPSGTTPEKKDNVLVWLYKSMGTRYVVIFLIVTFNGIALVVMITLGLRQQSLCPARLAGDFETLLDAKEYQKAYSLARRSKSFLGKILTAGMANLSEGYQAATDAMESVGEVENLRMEQRNSHIALIAQIGPMLGLLATVDGIVSAFAVIAGKNVTPKPSELASSIGIALVNTIVGLWLAIPAIIYYHLVRNRLSRMVLEVGVISTRLMKRFTNTTVEIDPDAPLDPEEEEEDKEKDKEKKGEE